MAESPPDAQPPDAQPPDAQPPDATQRENASSAPASANANASASDDLTLPEALLMLALGDEEGRIEVGNTTALPFGLTAAVLLALASRERLRHEDDLWIAHDDAPTGDPALDPALRAIAVKEEPRGTMHWLRALTETDEDDDLQQRILHHLTDRGVLEEEKHSILGVYSYRRYPTRVPDPERRVRERVRKVVLEDESPDDRTLALIALMVACNLTDEVFSAKEQDEHAGRLDALTERERVAHAVSAVDEETTAAVLMATTAATTAATATL